MTRPRANRLGMYADVRSVLDAALVGGGGTVECDSHNAAVHWRQRAYRFRKLYAETLGAGRESAYDTLVLPRVPADSATITIQIRSSTVLFTPADGAPVLDDDLFDIAQNLAKKIL